MHGKENYKTLNFFILITLNNVDQLQQQSGSCI